MSRLDDEAERGRHQRAEQRIDWQKDRDQPATGVAALVGTLVDSAEYPTTPGVFYRILVTTVTGEEVEGGPVTVNGKTREILAFNLGDAVPPKTDAGGLPTAVLVWRVPRRWVFEWRA